MAGNSLQGTTHPVPNQNAVGASALGERRVQFNSNGEPRTEMLLYVPSALQAKLTVGRPYFVDYASTAGQYIQAAAPAGNATSGVARLCVVLQDNALRQGTAPVTGSYGWFAFEGVVSVLVDGTTSVAAGDYLRSNSAVISAALIKDASTRSTLSVGVALAAQAAASAVAINVFLFGESALIA